MAEKIIKSVATKQFAMKNYNLAPEISQKVFVGKKLAGNAHMKPISKFAKKIVAAARKGGFQLVQTNRYGVKVLAKDFGKIFFA